MKVSWTAGDAISITPGDGMTFWQAGEYTLPDGGGTAADPGRSGYQPQRPGTV